MYRDIQPAPLPAGERCGPHGHNGGGDQQKKPIVEACHDCRRLKIKCDAARPKCGHCHMKRRRCGYKADERISGMAVVTTRLRILENLVTSLRTLPPDQAEGLLLQLRSNPGLDPNSPLPLSPEDASHPTLTPTSSRQSSSISPMGMHGQHATPPMGSLESSLTANTPSPPAVPQAYSETPIRRLGLVWLPPPELTDRFVDRFFSCSGKLFHLFSRDQVRHCYESTFREPDSTSLDHKADVCCLMIVAAIGAQYEHQLVDLDVQQMFYDTAKHYLEAVIEKRPFDAVKVCTLFCLYNIMDKTTVAVAYAEIGLGTCKRYGLERKQPSNSDLPESLWLECRKAWRTLVFFSSWLSVSLGYVPGNCEPSFEVQLSDLELTDSTEMTEIVQNEMAKIALLKAKVMRMHLAFKDLTPLSIRSIMDDLQSWYKRLPPQMQLENIMQEAPTASIRRSSFHVHLLYLGGMMLCYRRIASQMLQSSGTNRAHVPFPDASMALVLEQCEQAVVAASSSARILRLMLQDQGIFKRCWLIIFQSYTSCVILLHCVAQKQVHNMGPSHFDRDLRNAEHCLEVLAFCGTLDPVAAQFHEQLSALHRHLEAKQSPHGNCMPHATTENATESLPIFLNSQPPPPPLLYPDAALPLTPASGGRYLLTIPPYALPGRVRVSRTLLTMLCNPFGNHSMRKAAEDDVKNQWRGADPTRLEATQMVERLDWSFESAQPFRLNVGDLAQQGRAAAWIQEALQQNTAPNRGPDRKSGPPGIPGAVASAAAVNEEVAVMFGRMRNPEPCGWVSMGVSGV